VDSGSYVALSEGVVRFELGSYRFRRWYIGFGGKLSLSMENWKRVLLRAAGVGAGFAICAGMILGVAAWWSGRPTKPRPMNKQAITATFAGMAIQTRDGLFHFDLTYGLRNNTEKDYQLPAIGWFMIINSENKGLDTVDGVKWDSNVIIPPGQTVNVKFEIPYRLSEYNIKAEDLVPDRKEIEFAQRRMKEMAGFRFFDNTQRYEIDFPKWPVSSDTP
jgi:hypothetical protein